MDCPDCNTEMEPTDTTYSNIETIWAKYGQHTGDIYYCESCDIHWIDNFLSGKIEKWNYST